jgi:hypothetical protein
VSQQWDQVSERMSGTDFVVAKGAKNEDGRVADGARQVPQ